MSCATAGNCSAGGYYQDGSGHRQAFVVSQAQTGLPPSTTTLALSAPSVAFGTEQAERMSVTVSSAGTPTGTVTVTAGTTHVCTITLAAGAGSCTLQPTQLPVGTYLVTASYSGDANTSPSASSQQTLTVTAGQGSVTSITRSIGATTPMYNINLAVGLKNVTCPATLSLTAGSLAPRTVSVCASGQTPPSSVHVLQPVFNSSGTLPPNSTFGVTASVNGGPSFSTSLPTPPAPIWIGLGDSLSSGWHQTPETPGSFCPVVDEPTCLSKNDSSYSWVSDGSSSAAALVNARLHVPSVWQMTWDMQAKGGAKTTEWNNSGGQIDNMISDIESHFGSWNVVSFTGGADDANLGGIFTKWYLNNPNTEPWTVGSWSPSSCPDSNAFYNNVKTAASSIKSAIKNMIATASATGTSTRFVDVEYPYIVATGNVCGVNHSTSTGTWIGSNAAVNYLDSLQASIKAPGLVYVNLRNHFDTSALLSDLQLTTLFGYPHPDTTGQKLIAKLAAAAVK